MRRRVRSGSSAMGDPPMWGQPLTGGSERQGEGRRRAWPEACNDDCLGVKKCAEKNAYSRNPAASRACPRFVKSCCEIERPRRIV